MDKSDVAPVIVTTLITVAVTTLILVRMWLRARSAKQVGSPELREIVARLERMEQSIDAMAVETERISEGQRFTTKLLNERTKEPAPRT